LSLFFVGTDARALFAGRAMPLNQTQRDSLRDVVSGTVESLIEQKCAVYIARCIEPNPVRSLPLPLHPRLRRVAASMLVPCRWSRVVCESDVHDFALCAV
jgi:hypothetical protein